MITSEESLVEIAEKLNEIVDSFVVQRIGLERHNNRNEVTRLRSRIILLRAALEPFVMPSGHELSKDQRDRATIAYISTEPDTVTDYE